MTYIKCNNLYNLIGVTQTALNCYHPVGFFRPFCNDPVCLSPSSGCHRENHEDAESPEAPAAPGGGPEPALLQVQTQSPSHQGDYRLVTLLQV